MFCCLWQGSNTLSAEIVLAASATVVRKLNGEVVTDEQVSLWCGRRESRVPHLGSSRADPDDCRMQSLPGATSTCSSMQQSQPQCVRPCRPSLVARVMGLLAVSATPASARQSMRWQGRERCVIPCHAMQLLSQRSVGTLLANTGSASSCSCLQVCQLWAGESGHS